MMIIAGKSGVMTRFIMSLAILLVLAGPARAGCDRARALYDQALAAQGEARARLLQGSVDQCPTYEGYYELGKARYRAGELVRAQEAFREAFRLAAGPKAATRVLANLGQAYEAEGRLLEAVDSYKVALKTIRSLGAQADRLEGALKKVELKVIRAGLSPRQISRALRFRGFQAEPSLDLRILFEYDRARLTPEGREISGSLGRALTDPFFASKSFVLIGHTDKRGTDQYNQVLSERRAQAVAEFLGTGFQGVAGRLRTEGRGKRELLYSGETEEDHQLNRRVEVRVID